MSENEPVRSNAASGKAPRPLLRVGTVFLLIAAAVVGACFWFWRLSSTEQRLVGTWTCTDDGGAQQHLQMSFDRSYAIAFRNPEDEQFKTGSSGRWRADGREIVFTMQGSKTGNPVARALNRLVNKPDQTVFAIVELTDDRLVTRYVETGVEWEWTRWDEDSDRLRADPLPPTP